MLENKVVLITGAGSGIGAATTLKFAQAKAKLVITELSLDRAKEIASTLDEMNADYLLVEADISKYEDIQKMLDAAKDKFGRIDILVNNAGTINLERVKTHEHSNDEWERIIAVNQTGVFYCMKLVLALMLEQEAGNIVNVASIAGQVASKNNIAYTASKFAVVGMTKSAAREYASKNIRINCVCPGYTKTNMFDSIAVEHPEFAQKLLWAIPMRRYGQAEEIADAIIWLASEKSKYMTGQNITLDGGLTS